MSNDIRSCSPCFVAALIVIAFMLVAFFIILSAYEHSLQEPAATVCRNEFRQIVGCP